MNSKHHARRRPRLAHGVSAAALLLSLAACHRPAEREDVLRLSNELRSSSEDVQRGALQSLTELGPHAEGALPAVVSLFERSQGALRGEAVITLVALDPSGREAVPAIRQVLSDPTPEVREIGAIALGLLGAPGDAAYEQVRYLEHDDALEVRSAAVYAAVKVRPTEHNIRAAYALLSGPDPRGRFMAARALRELGPSAVKELPPIFAAMHDDNVGTAVQALGIVEQLGTRASAASAALLKLVERAEVADHAVDALRAVDPDGNHSARALAACVRSCTTPEARGRAAFALSPYIKHKSESVPALLLALHDADPRVAMSALDALRALRPDYPLLREGLLALMKDGPMPISWKAAEMLASYGPVCFDDVQRLQTGDKRSRLQGAYALSKLLHAQASERVLQAALTDPDPEVRAQARVAARDLPRGGSWLD
jgi:HEAT repeat protein